jgi:hypothetical protein
MSLPPELLREVHAHDETVLGSLLTAGRHAFVDAAGEVHGAAVWCVLTDRRAWLLSTHDGQTWGVAAGATDEVSLQHGWSRDGLQVGSHTVSLRRGTRAAATALLDRWRTVEPDGAPWPPQAAPDPGARAGGQGGGRCASPLARSHRRRARQRVADGHRDGLHPPLQQAPGHDPTRPHLDRHHRSCPHPRGTRQARRRGVDHAGRGAHRP